VSYGDDRFLPPRLMGRERRNSSQARDYVVVNSSVQLPGRRVCVGSGTKSVGLAAICYGADGARASSGRPPEGTSFFCHTRRSAVLFTAAAYRMVRETVVSSRFGR